MSHPLVEEHRPTSTIEDYLAIMYTMERDGEDIIAARLAESLGVTPPTVTVTLKRMERDGWIDIRDSREICLTEPGRMAGSSVIRRHMLTEWMLARILKVPWSHVHGEAHLIEHSISDDVEDRLRQNFDDPKICPHGNPLPGYERLADRWKSLMDIQPGTQVAIRRIHESAEADSELMQFLEDNQIIPGSIAEVNEILPYNQTLTLSIGGRQVVLGFTAALAIYVEEI